MSSPHELTPRIRNAPLETRCALGRCAFVGCGGARHWGCPACGVFFCSSHTPPRELRLGARCPDCGAAMELER